MIFFFLMSKNRSYFPCPLSSSHPHLAWCFHEWWTWCLGAFQQCLQQPQAEQCCASSCPCPASTAVLETVSSRQTSLPLPCRLAVGRLDAVSDEEEMRERWALAEVAVRWTGGATEGQTLCSSPSPLPSQNIFGWAGGSASTKGHFQRRSEERFNVASPTSDYQCLGW